MSSNTLHPILSDGLVCPFWTMLYLAFIFHMHQPYYKNLLTQVSELPWVRLHGIKDYLDMLKILEKYPRIRQTFNLVPSLVEQVEDFTNRTVKDKFLGLSYKPAKDLSPQDKEFILANFFSINREKVIAFHPRFYELYFKRERNQEFTTQDFLDLQVWFNLAWTDPYFRQNFKELKEAVKKGRFFSEEDKAVVLDKQLEILEEIIPAYKRLQDSGQIEVTVTPYYHPILPLLYNTKLAKEANPKNILPQKQFAFPEDAKAQVDMAVEFYRQRFGALPKGMWPSEQSVCEHILPFLIQSGVKWIVTDEAILYKSLKMKKRDTKFLYQPHLIKRDEGSLEVVFRDRNLSDMIGFVYHTWSAEDAVKDFMRHLENIAKALKGKDALVTIAMDGENAWEYYRNDGHEFLSKLYEQLSDSKTITTVTVAEYLSKFKPNLEIKRLAAGSWIYGNFGKWIGNAQKAKAWDWLTDARVAFASVKHPSELARKQMYICEGSDWFWWAGEDPDGSFDRLYRTHLTNLYVLLEKQPPEYLNKPLEQTP